MARRSIGWAGTTSACAENTTTRRQPAAIIGTTSACAENTLLSISHQGRAWNYLRVRGEYTRKILTRITSRELPPRARRIRSTGLLDPIDGRTTSACAENTLIDPLSSLLLWNYLRVRGEYRHDPMVGIQHVGTTSACAENTVPPWLTTRSPWNYLRVRGEYSPIWVLGGPCHELPPRARRIHYDAAFLLRLLGTTSACAENTRHECGPWRLLRNYLRVRGEYPVSPWNSWSTRELPPRARRIHCNHSVILTFPGTTSACAENTCSSFPPPCHGWNYLRVRGEYHHQQPRPRQAAELPPRARRIPRVFR